MTERLTLQNPPKRMPCPDNEFTDFCTADMPTADLAWHYWLDATKYNQTQRREWLEAHRLPMFKKTSPR